MSGILDSKVRMFDTIITREGRRQMAAGDLRVEFVTFTDAETFYAADEVSGSEDPSGRIMLEVTSLPQDQVTFEADDSGLLKPFKNSQLDVLHGKILSGTSEKFLDVVTGSEFASTAETLLDSSIDSFQKLLAIRTEDVFFDADTEFQTNTNSIKFTVNDVSPIRKRMLKSVNVDKIESLFQDKRLSRVINFKYLPPVNKPSAVSPKGSPLGDYPVLGQRREELTWDELQRELSGRESTVVEFSSTTQLSNVVSQMFELKQDRLLKLDVIDFGEILTDDEFSEKHVFFVGKLFVDGFGAHTFVNMFTLVFE